MCGIAGFFGTSGTLPLDQLTRMTTAMVHRGPDDEGYMGVDTRNHLRRWDTPESHEAPLRRALSFRRLSILDLSRHGAQPMEAGDGRYWIVFNGQIYNYVEMRREMRDVAFRSRGDTEVLLHHLIQKGMNGLNELFGMFAFAFYDREQDTLWLARDPLGIKPLYYRQTAEGLWFASEIRALYAGVGDTPRLRTPLLSRYLLSNWIPDPDTLFEGVSKLEPGHYLKISGSGEMEKVRYWNFAFQPDERRDVSEWVEDLDHALHGTISRQMRSDVPLGFFLSGGVDSSLLAVKALQSQDRHPATFTTGFQWGRGETDLDLKSARRLRDRFPFEYHELVLEPSVVGILPKVVECLEEPLADPAALCSYLICEAASEKFKVLISGQGADELFGGYPVYQAGWLATQLHRLPGRSPLRRLAGHLPYSVAGRTLQTVHRLNKILAAAEVPWPDAFFLLRAPLQTAQTEALLQAPIREAQQSPFARYQELFRDARDWDPIHQMMYLDAKTYLPNLNLTYGDKTSMAHSVELRVPFLDPQVVRLVEQMPSRLKVGMREGKILLKAVARQHLPPYIIQRRKAGFGLPLKEWFWSDLQPMASDLLSPDRLRAQGLFEPELPTRWLREHREKKADHCMKLYSLMTFQLWLDTHGVRL